MEELLLDWLDPFLTVEEKDRLLGWHLGVSFYFLAMVFSNFSLKAPSDGGGDSQL